MRPVFTRVGVVIAVGALALTACGSDKGTTTTTAAGSLGKELKGASFTVGSKDFAESIILGKITEDMLKAHGATVADKTNIKGSANTRKALQSKNIDIYWDYTGTGWITYLGNTKPIADPEQQFTAVKAADLAKNKIVWVDRAPLNNTYAFAVKTAKAAELKVKTLSDVAALAKSNAGQATFCIESEFSTRDDGFPGMVKAYGMTIPKPAVKMLDTGVIYSETGKGKICNFGEVFATDGRIAALKLTVMDDDKHFFPVYNAAVTMRQDTATKYPKIAEILAPVAAKLDNTTMQGLNARVDVNGEEPAAVASDWLTKNGFLK